MIVVRVTRLFDGARLPAYMTDGAAGMDLSAALAEPIVIAPGKRKLVGSGVAIALPPGYEAQVRPRSGLALKYGVTVLNAPGTVDEDYRGEIKVLLINHGEEPFAVQHGDRIAQLVVQKVARVTLEVHASLDDTKRGDGGYGHTGR